MFAVCDPEREYTAAFSGYLTRRKAVPMDITAFSDSEKLLAYAEDNPIDLLLINPVLLTPEVKELPVPSIVLLTDGDTIPEYGEYPCVSKYQACSEVIRQVLQNYKGSSDPECRSAALKRGIEIFGIFSPVARSGKTTFALTLAQILGRSRSVLYVNLESYSGFQDLLGSEGTSSLCDLLYYAGQKTDNISVSLLRCLAGTVAKAGKIDYIPPVVFPWDLREAEGSEFTRLIDILSRESGYEVLVLDIGNETEDVLHILDRCTHIMMPVFRDRISLAKVRQYEEALKSWGAHEILEKTIRIRPPEDIPTGTGTALLEQLESSRMGGYVRQILNEQIR